MPRSSEEQACPVHAPDRDDRGRAGRKRVQRRRDSGVVDRLDLERALAALPAGCRAVFVLHDVEGCEHKEIAALLDISDGTSKSQLHKARMRLRGLLAGGGPTTGTA